MEAKASRTFELLIRRLVAVFRSTPRRLMPLLAALFVAACGADGSDGEPIEEQQEPLTAVYQVNVGGGAVSPFSADQFGNGGNFWTDNVTVSTAGVANAAPADVYKSERYGNFSFTFPSLTAGASYTVRLHFAENHWNSAGARVFNVIVNGSQVLTNFDIFANAGGANKALVRDFTATASGSGQIVVQYVTVVDNAKASGIEILANGGGSNAAPTVATAASANPNPTNGTTSALSVLGADDGGESNLIYTWATTGTPPAAVSFSANATNAARNTTATFTKAGTYSFAATIRDTSGATVTSNVNVTVNPTLTSIGVTPATAQVATGGTQSFSATAKDQFGNALSTQPGIGWAVSGGGSINSSGLFTAGGVSGGPFTVTATSGAFSGTASVTVTPSGSGTPVYRINVGGGAVSPFSADQFASGGNGWTDNVTVSTAGVANAAPADVYKSERYGNFSYTFPSLTAGSSYTVRLHFAENRWTTSGARVFNVLVNGSQVLTNFDIFANAGATKALVRDFTATASGSGQIVVQYVTVVDNAKASGIEILANGGGSNTPPTVATAASANPNPTNGTTSALSVLGADNGGESALTYTWATTGTPPAAVSFSANGTNAAKNTTATFTKAGAYSLMATIRDAGGATVTSSVNVSVNQKITSIGVSPASASVAPNTTRQFGATANDQFATAMSPQPTFAWSVSGGGTINASGLFTAGSSNGGPFTVTVTSAAVSGTASVTITGSGQPQPIGIPGTWDLAFSDEFSGSAIDTSKWRILGAGVPAEWGSQTWRAADSFLDGNGLLVTRLTNATGSITGGAIDSKWPLWMGYYEARIKQDGGGWFAYWIEGLRNGGGGANEDPAVYGTEMDIAEAAGWANPIDIEHAVHWHGYGQWHQTVSAGSGIHDTNWHTYGFMWTATAYDFYVDGVLTWHFTAAISQAHDQRMIINNASFQNRQTNGLGYVDYVRYWTPR